MADTETTRTFSKVKIDGTEYMVKDTTAQTNISTVTDQLNSLAKRVDALPTQSSSGDSHTIEEIDTTTNTYMLVISDSSSDSSSSTEN